MNKPASDKCGTVNVSLPQPVIDALRRCAAAEDKSVSRLVLRALEAEAKRRRNGGKK